MRFSLDINIFIIYVTKVQRSGKRLSFIETINFPMNSFRYKKEPFNMQSKFKATNKYSTPCNYFRFYQQEIAIIPFVNRERKTS